MRVSTLAKTILISMGLTGVLLVVLLISLLMGTTVTEIKTLLTQSVLGSTLKRHGRSSCHTDFQERFWLQLRVPVWLLPAWCFKVCLRTRWPILTSSASPREALWGPWCP